MRLILRVSKKIIVIIEVILAVVVFGTWAVCTPVFENDKNEMLFSACVFIYIIVATIIYTYYSTKVADLYKNYFVVSTVKENFDNAYYNHEKGYDRDMVKNMGFTMMGNRYRSEDFISASYKGVPFQRADVVVEHHTSSGKSSHTVTYFKGIVYRFKLTKYYPVALQVRSLDDSYAAFPMGVGKRDVIETESMAFNNMFKSFCKDGHTAFYILTPPIIERLCRLEANFGPMVINFYGEEAVIALNRKQDSLEPPSVFRMDYATEKKRVLNQLAEVCIFER